MINKSQPYAEKVWDQRGNIKSGASKAYDAVAPRVKRVGESKLPSQIVDFYKTKMLMGYEREIAGIHSIVGTQNFVNAPKTRYRPTFSAGNNDLVVSKTFSALSNA